MLGRASVVGLVEDSDEDHAAFVRLARQEVPEVQIVRWVSAEDFLAHLAVGDDSRQPDVLVADLNLPGIDGAELTRRIRQDPVAGALSVFVLSGSSRQTDVDRCYGAGANAYLTKPGSVTELRALVRMLFRTMATFRAPSPAPAGAAPPAAAPAVVDQAAVDAERAQYEAELRAERDRERRGRERAEALQRLTAKLANAGDTGEVEAALVDALTRRPGRPAARVLPPTSEAELSGVMFMPDPFGAGTIAMLPLQGHAGLHGTLRVQTTDDLAEDEEAFLHAAVGLASQALARVGRINEIAHRARVAAVDLPTERWWKGTIEAALTRARRSGQPLTLVVVLPREQERFDADHGVVQGDARLLAIIDAWREAGHDLYSPSGGDRWVALIEDHRGAADAIAETVVRQLGDEPAFVWGSAQWDRREEADALLFRAATGFARDGGTQQSA